MKPPEDINSTSMLHLMCPMGWGHHICCRPVQHDGPCWCDCCECVDHPDLDSGCVAGPPYYGPHTLFVEIEY